MRISTSQMYNQGVSSILDKQSSTNKLLQQLDSGKKVNTAGDDPYAAIAIDNLNQKNSQIEQYIKNIDYSQNRLSNTENLLGSAENAVMSVKDLLLAASNGSLTATERQTLASEMQGNLDALMAIANSQDEAGNYIFGGFNNDSAPFSFDNSGKVVYAGDSGVRQSLVASGVSMGTNIPGNVAFMQAANPLGDFGVKYLANQQGELTVSSAKITDSGAHIPQNPNTYSVTFNDNGAGGISAAIVGGSGDVWNVDPVDPAAPLSVNGIDIQLASLPTAGDGFTLEAQREVSILDSLNQAIALVSDETRINSPAGQSELAQLLNNIDSGFNQLGTARAATGTALKQLEHYSGAHTEEQLVNKSALTLLEDLDFAEAFSEFQKQQLALNAVSSVFSKINSTSLFDYL